MTFSKFSSASLQERARHSPARDPPGRGFHRRHPIDQPRFGTGQRWGQVLPEFFAEDVTIKNAAANGRSSKSFIDEGRWQKALDEKPNYVFILWEPTTPMPILPATWIPTQPSASI